MAALILALPGAALADLTADEVWQDWQAQARSGGQTLAAGRTEPGPGRITLRDLTLSGEGSDGPVSVTLPEVTLEEKGAEVAIRFPAEQEVTRTMTWDAESVTDRIRLVHPGLAVTASGEPGDITYTFAAPELTARLEGVSRGGSETEPVAFEMTFRAIDGRQQSLLRDGKRETASTFRAAGASGAFATTGEEAPLTGSLTVEDITYSANGRVPPEAGSSAALLAGAEWQSQLGHGPARIEIRAEGSPPLTAVTAGGRSESTLRDGRAAGSGAWEAGSVGLVLPGDERPASLAFDAVDARFALPLAESGAAEPFAFGLTLANLAPNDAAWALVDPQAVLPREPGELSLDLSGRMKPVADLTDPAAIEATGALPFEIETLDVNAFALALAGARLTGTGAFTFAPATPGAPGGLPRPEGTADLLLSGGDRLLTGLVRLGIVPDGQAMMIRMMASGFARPGDAPDTLTSRVELTRDGGLRVNGRALR